MTRRCGALLTLSLACLFACSAKAMGAPAPDTRLDWWRQARFGMFIHWGLYAQAAGHWNGKPVGGIGEWIMHYGQIPVAEYETLAPQFNPVKFKASDWVSVAKNAGMKYIIITSKHHDGFCMFDSKLTTYDIVDATPFKRDVLKELADECRRQDIKLGFYYSIMDWHHPDAKGEAFPRYVEHMKGQLKELLTNYGDIAVLWFDGEWIEEWTEVQGKELYAFCRSLQPSIIINNRVGKGRDGMAGLSKTKDAAGDFGTPEQEIPARGIPGLDWETCMTMNDTWGYKRDDHNWKSAPQLIRMLVDIASKGGNFLLNVGPTGEGEIPAPSVERLAIIGTWMKTNGQSIYGCAASPFDSPAWGRCTAGLGALYLHVFERPADGRITVPADGRQFRRAALLTEPRIELMIERGGENQAIIHVPPNPEEVASVVRLEVE